MDITAQRQYNNVPAKAMDSQADWCIISITTTPAEVVETSTTYISHTCTKTCRYTEAFHKCTTTL